MDPLKQNRLKMKFNLGVIIFVLIVVSSIYYLNRGQKEHKPGSSILSAKRAQSALPASTHTISAVDVVPMRLREPEKLTRSELGEKSLIQLRAAVEIDKDPSIYDDSTAVSSVGQAWALFYGHTSIANDMKPERWCEDDKYYYFSGGHHADRVMSDFSCGFAIIKATGGRVSWENLRFDQQLAD
jgi:hypothetical protein